MNDSNIGDVCDDALTMLLNTNCPLFEDAIVQPIKGGAGWHILGAFNDSEMCYELMMGYGDCGMGGTIRVHRNGTQWYIRMVIEQ